MRRSFAAIVFAALFIHLSITSSALAQFKDEVEAGGTTLGEEKVHKWRCGLVMSAVGGDCKDVHGYIPVPNDWPEQQVSIVAEEISPEVKVWYETVNKTVKVMKVRIPQLAAGQEAKAIVTFEIKRHTILPPEKTEGYTIPDPIKLPNSLRQYLTKSPKIESDDSKIKALAKEIGAEKEDAWEKVEAFFDWVRENIKYEKGPLKGALAALKDKTGDCEELTSLFIALCRASNVPARTVWVHGHCYPEFYLLDASGTGHWFPCQAAGGREFGGIIEDRPILQKGDSFKTLEGKKSETQRYLAEYLTGTPVKGGQPRVRAIRELVN